MDHLEFRVSGLMFFRMQDFMKALGVGERERVAEGQRERERESE